MSIVVLVLDTADASFGLGPHACRALARLGVRRVAVMEDGATVGVLLEGWAFDPASTARAIDALDTLGAQPRVLLPVLDMSVSATEVNALELGRASKGEAGWTTSR
jgi:hypothetical protein